MKRRKQQEVSPTWISDLSDRLALQVARYIDSVEDEQGPEVARQLTANFFAAFTALTVSHALTRSELVGADAESQYEFTSMQLAEQKKDIQDAVAAGFTGAMSTFAGKHVEYYCQVKLVPEPANKTVN